MRMLSALAAAALAGLSAASAAAWPGEGSFASGLADIRTALQSQLPRGGFKASARPAPEPSPELRFSLPVPVSLLDRFVKDAVAAHPLLALADSRRPVLRAEGGELVVSNIILPRLSLPSGRTELGRPTLYLRPFCAGRNRIGLRVRQVLFDEHSLVGAANTAGWLSDERLFLGIAEGLEAQAGPGELVRISHDAARRELDLDFSPGAILPAAPEVSFDRLELAGESLVLSLNIARPVPAGGAGEYEFVLGEGLLNRLLQAVSDDRISFQRLYGRPSGAFLGVPRPGDVEVSGLVNTGLSLPFPFAGRQLHAVFVAVVRPSVVAANTVRIEIASLESLWLGAGPQTALPNVPAFIQSHPGVQRLIADRVAKALAEDAELARYVSARQAGPGAVELRLKETAVLPALARYIEVRSLLVETGRLRLGYALRDPSAPHAGKVK
ncbi:MAG: hypothetical protein NTY77_07880 [Elusimicrobia bacterium]|nr:hypothetical protein [Elusimicrobiota bacterium]